MRELKIRRGAIITSSCGFIYKKEDGSEVKVTQVVKFDNERDAINYRNESLKCSPDIMFLGKVSEFVRKVE